MQIVIVGSNSGGMKVDAEVLRQALALGARSLGAEVEIQTVHLPWRMYLDDSPVRADRLKLSRPPDVVIFLENIIAVEPAFPGGAVKILVPNLEWMSSITERRMSQIDQVWHKSRTSLDTLTEAFADVSHHYLGFTSIDPNLTVQGYDAFAHFRGKAPRRHSNEIISAWRSRPDYPVLKHHFYSDDLDPDAFVFSEWLSWNNIRVRVGKMEQAAYFDALKSCGIHLCTSAGEGFGHYINEARAMSAVAVVVDAAPMNELIDETCGILIPPRTSYPCYRGRRHRIETADIVTCIDAILGMDTDALARLGARARQRFLDERAQFEHRTCLLLRNLLAGGV